MRDPSTHAYRPLRDHARHRRNQLRRVLVIGVHHDDDVGALIERELITGLLVAAVSEILRMHVHHHALEAAGQPRRVVLAGIVDDDDQIDDVVRDHFAPRFFDGVLRVVGGHDDHDPGLLRHHSFVRTL